PLHASCSRSPTARDSHDRVARTNPESGRSGAGFRRAWRGHRSNRSPARSASRSARQKTLIAPRLVGIGRPVEVVHHHRTAELSHLGVQAFLALAIERLGPTHRFDDNIAPNPA